MPIYEYKCRDCSEIKEILIKSENNSNNIQCDSCGSRDMVKMISRPNVRVSQGIAPMPKCGKETTCCGSAEPCEKPPCDS